MPSLSDFSVVPAPGPPGPAGPAGPQGPQGIPGPVGNTDALAEGTTNLYHTPARVRATALDGLSTATGTAVVAADSMLVAVGKLQRQITNLPPSTPLALILVTRVGINFITTDNAPYRFDTIETNLGSAITYSTGLGTFSLPPGRRFLLEAQIALAAPGGMDFRWNNDTGGGVFGTMGVALAVDFSSSQGAAAIAKAVIETPAGPNTVVSLRPFASANTNLGPRRCWASITELPVRQPSA